MHLMHNATKHRELRDSCNEQKSIPNGGTMHWDVNVRAESRRTKEKERDVDFQSEKN